MPSGPGRGRWARGAALASIALILALAFAAPASARIIFRLQNRKPVSLADLVQDLKRARVVLIGERHDSAEDHAAQRTVIQALHDAGAKVSIGLEMFRAEEQPALDRWVTRAMERNEARIHMATVTKSIPATSGAETWMGDPSLSDSRATPLIAAIPRRYPPLA